MRKLIDVQQNIDRTPEDLFRLESDIKKHLMTCTRSSETFNYLGSLCFRHKKISTKEYEAWWKWWEKEKPRIVREEKTEQQKMEEIAIRVMGVAEEKKRLEEEEKREMKLKLKDIPF